MRYKYASGAELLCTPGQHKGALDPRESKVPGRARAIGHGNGILFVGEDDKWIFVNREGITASDPKLIEEKLPDNATRLYVSPGHMRNWVECVRSRKEPNAPVEAGYQHSIACVMANAAARTGQRVTFDEARQEVIAGGKVFHL